jgi:hypothetical protein
MRRVKIGQHSLLLIVKGELHQIRNTGRGKLRTINFYAPPAYDEEGQPLVLSALIAAQKLQTILTGSA